jgi:death-on-curing protein
MEGFSGEIVYLSLDQICDVNRRMIDAFGGYFEGSDNLRNRESLEYILILVSSFALFGENLYMTLKEKAAAIAHHIISRHIFHDGNKRTGIHAAWEFLHANGVALNLDPTIADLAEAIADSTASYDDLLEWLHDHQ